MLNAVIDLIIQQEKQLLDKSAPVNLLVDLIDDEFFEIGSRSMIHDKAEVKRWLTSGEASLYQGSSFKAHPLSEDIILITYLSFTKDPSTGKTKQAMRSSLWRFREEKWRIVFHQGTSLKEAT